MPVKQLLVSLHATDARAAKADFLVAARHLPGFDRLEVIGEDTGFAALVFQGPSEAVERFAEFVGTQLADRVRAVEWDEAQGCGAAKR